MHAYYVEFVAEESINLIVDANSYKEARKEAIRIFEQAAKNIVVESVECLKNYGE